MRLLPDRIGPIHDLARDDLWPAERLAAEVQHRAAVLTRLMRPGTNHVVIAHGDSAAFFADLFAVWQAGACAVCVNPALAASELANVVAFVDARAVLVADGAATAAAALAGPVPVLCTADEPAPAHADVQASGSLDDLALVLFTSGTTGQPKGVVHSHRSIQARVALNLQHGGPALRGAALCVLPTHFGHGLIGNGLTPLLNGGSLFLLHATGVAAAQHLGEVVQQHRIGFMSSVPAFWKLALRLSAPPPGILQRVHIGSAPLSAALWRAVIDWAGTDAVANLYGMTETANWAGGAVASQSAPEDGLLGQPWGGRFAVRGADGLPQARGDGEILVQSPSLMTGYLHRPELSAEVLVGGWYRSGDIGQIGDDGLLRMTGRLRHVINRAGIKVYPEELDLLFEQHPLVQEACAFAMPDLAGGEAVGLALTLRGGASAQAREFMQWARSRIRPDAVPSRVFIVDALPKSDRGKLQRDAVARRCLDSRPSQVPT